MAAKAIAVELVNGLLGILPALEDHACEALAHRGGVHRTKRRRNARGPDGASLSSLEAASLALQGTYPAEDTR